MADWTRRGAIAGAAALFAGGCARRDPHRLTLWAMGYEGDYAPLLMPAFTARTGWPVEVQSVPWTAAHQKLLTAFAGEALPDVVMLPNGWVPELAMIGALAPLARPALLDDLFPGADTLMRYRGQAYAVPWAAAPQAQFFRRDLLAAAGYAAPPERWADWRTCLAALKRRQPDRFPLLALLNWWDLLFTFAGQTGAPMLREAGTRGDFADPRFVAALAFYVGLFADGLAPRVLSTEVQDPIDEFVRGRIAIYPIGPEMLKDLERRRHALDPARWGVARMPGPAGPGPVSGVSSSLAVTVHSRAPAAAFALLDHLTSPAAELRFQHYIGALPARQRAWRAPVLARDPRLRPFERQLFDPAATPAVVEWERIRIEVQLVAERVVRGLVPLADAPAEMNRRADRILAKRRWLVERGRLA